MSTSASGRGTRRRTQQADLAGLDQQTVHELRNALAGVRGAIQVVREPMPEGSMEREILAEVLDRLRPYGSLSSPCHPNQKSAVDC